MTDDQLLRYSRHILLDEIGIEGQERILASRVLMVGAGGLGSAAALYLACAGVGHLTVVDHDCVDLTNLQRQIAHTTQRVGQPKARSVQVAIAGLNPEVVVKPVELRADAALLEALLAQHDVVLDCSDNFATRHAINAASVYQCKPLVSGAAIRFDGQITVYDPRDDASPCYACLFPPEADFEETQCATMGVFAPLVGIIGTMQAAEALKLISGAAPALSGRLLMLDGRAMAWTEVRLPRNPSCPVCKKSGPHSP
ncbi:MAG: molybdopterin-synthase adenylyltransferase MoeB [Rhodoferax sp.]|nr:molybdopterin-synthase adenylyltransferase MoeB [Rhodoferax sp.]